MPVVEVELTDSGPRARRQTRDGFHAARVVSPLEFMELQSRRRLKGQYQPLFTNRQHVAASDYAALFERVNGGRVKCSNLEATGGGSDGGGFMDALVDDGQRLRRMHAAIGSGSALFNASPSARSDQGRRRIGVLDVVDRFCVHRASAKDVLVAFGWSPQTRYRNAIRQALCVALDGLYGI
jgi:hypothetical protein